MKYFNCFEGNPLYMSHFSPTKDWNSRNSRKKAIKKRKRKSNDQLQVLVQQFEMSSEWDKDVMSSLAKKTGLSEAQIYKWSWDQKKKLENQEKIKSQKRFHLCEIFENLPDLPHFEVHRASEFCDKENLACMEIASPRSIDYDLNYIQKQYRHSLDSLCSIKNPHFNYLDNFLQEFSRL